MKDFVRTRRSKHPASPAAKPKPPTLAELRREARRCMRLAHVSSTESHTSPGVYRAEATCFGSPRHVLIISVSKAESRSLLLAHLRALPDFGGKL